jgi:Fic family protein
MAKEATASSKIEGTHTYTEKAVLGEADIDPIRRNDWQEVKNYIPAMNHAMSRWPELPLSSRLVRKTHQILLSRVRGAHKLPGEYRKNQNRRGGSSLGNAFFVPPVREDVHTLSCAIWKISFTAKTPGSPAS